MICASGNAPRPRLIDLMADVQVGDFRVMPYGQAKSCVTLLRALNDGRRWSLRQAPEGHSTTSTVDYSIWRVA